MARQGQRSDASGSDNSSEAPSTASATRPEVPRPGWPAMLPFLVTKLAGSVAELACDLADLVCRLPGCLGAAPVLAGLRRVAARQLLMNLGQFFSCRA